MWDSILSDISGGKTQLRNAFSILICAKYLRKPCLYTVMWVSIVFLCGYILHVFLNINTRLRGLGGALFIHGNDGCVNYGKVGLIFFGKVGAKGYFRFSHLLMRSCSPAYLESIGGASLNSPFWRRRGSGQIEIREGRPPRTAFCKFYFLEGDSSATLEVP